MYFKGECEGCASFSEKDKECNEEPDQVQIIHSKCPCIRCIVKTMCERECCEFDKFILCIRLILEKEISEDKVNGS